VVFFSWNLNQKGLIYYYAYANIANRIVLSFVWRKFSSVGIGEWWDEMKNGQKLKLRYAHVTPKNIQEVQASKLGDAPEAPLFHRQKSGHLSTHYIFIASCNMHFSWSVFTFCFQFCFVLFAAINGWTSINFFWRRCTRFSFAKNTLVFTLIVQRVFSFSRIAFSFRFSPWFLFRSCYIFASRCIWTSGLCRYSSKKLFQKGSNGVGNEKKFHAKKWYKKELV
jgi:hypothetical protein